MLQDGKSSTLSMMPILIIPNIVEPRSAKVGLRSNLFEIFELSIELLYKLIGTFSSDIKLEISNKRFSVDKEP